MREAQASNPFSGYAHRDSRAAHPAMYREHLSSESKSEPMHGDGVPQGESSPKSTGSKTAASASSEGSTKQPSVSSDTSVGKRRSRLLAPPKPPPPEILQDSAFMDEGFTQDEIHKQNMMMSPDASHDSASMHKTQVEHHLRSLIDIYQQPDKLLGRLNGDELTLNSSDFTPSNLVKAEPTEAQQEVKEEKEEEAPRSNSEVTRFK